LPVERPISPALARLMFAKLKIEFSPFSEKLPARYAMS
jgi:hypothetical protein